MKRKEYDYQMTLVYKITRRLKDSEADYFYVCLDVLGACSRDEGRFWLEYLSEKYQIENDAMKYFRYKKYKPKRVRGFDKILLLPIVLIYDGKWRLFKNES